VTSECHKLATHALTLARTG